MKNTHKLRITSFTLQRQHMKRNFMIDAMMNFIHAMHKKYNVKLTEVSQN